MLEKTYILRIISRGKYGGQCAEVAVEKPIHAIEIMSVLCEYATNPLDYEIKAVTPELEELSDEMPGGMTEAELNKALAETYDNIECD